MIIFYGGATGHRNFVIDQSCLGLWYAAQIGCGQTQQRDASFRCADWNRETDTVTCTRITDHDADGCRGPHEEALRARNKDPVRRDKSYGVASCGYHDRVVQKVWCTQKCGLIGLMMDPDWPDNRATVSYTPCSPYFVL